MKPIDKPIHKLTEILTDRDCFKDNLICFICKSRDCYDVVCAEDGIRKLCYSRNSKKWVCKKCHRLFIRLESIIEPLMNLIVRVLTKL